MVGEYRGRGGRQTRQFRELGHFLTSITSGRWILAHEGQAWRPPTDVYETDDSIVVKVEIAGMAADDLAITFVEATLVITGIRHDPSEKLGYHQMEIPYGEFRTEIYVPEPIETDGIDASYQDGFLLVTLPKLSSRRVTIGRR